MPQVAYKTMVSQANAKEVSTDAIPAAAQHLLLTLHYHVGNGTKNSTEGFSWVEKL